MESKVKELREILPTGSKEALEEKMNELSAEMQKIGGAMYGQQGAAGPQGGPEAGPEGGEGQAPNGDSDGSGKGDNGEGPVEGEVEE